MMMNQTVPKAGTNLKCGTVTDNNGQPLAGVTMILVSQMQPTQIVFTNQTRNYEFTNVFGGPSRTLTASKVGLYFQHPLDNLHFLIQR